MKHGYRSVSFDSLFVICFNFIFYISSRTSSRSSEAKSIIVPPIIETEDDDSDNEDDSDTLPIQYLNVS